MEEFLALLLETMEFTERKLTFNGGTVWITRSKDGIESSEITINDGAYIELTSTDDGLNASSGSELSVNHFYMHGGYLYINASGDGINSNGYIEMTGGMVVVNGPAGNDTWAIDYDKTFSLTGGTFLAVGSAGMVQSSSESTNQNTIMVTFTTAKQPHQLVHIEDEDGSQILTFSRAKSYQSLICLLHRLSMAPRTTFIMEELLPVPPPMVCMREGLTQPAY